MNKHYLHRWLLVYCEYMNMKICAAAAKLLMITTSISTTMMTCCASCKPYDVQINVVSSHLEFIRQMQDFTLDFYFRQFWTDPRLAYRKRPGVETLSVGSDFIKNIWVPDTFFVNEKQSYFHIATTSNEFIRVHHSGSITRSIR